MKKEVEEFLNKIINLNTYYESNIGTTLVSNEIVRDDKKFYVNENYINQLKNEAKNLLEESVKEETNKFLDSYLDYWYTEEKKEAIRNNNKIEIIYYCKGIDKYELFINKYFDKLDKVIGYMNDYLDLLEKENKNE